VLFAFLVWGADLFTGAGNERKLNKIIRFSYIRGRIAPRAPPEHRSEKRSAPRAGQRLDGAVASRWRPSARSLRDRTRLLLGASERRVLEGVGKTVLSLLIIREVSFVVFGGGGRQRASFPIRGKICPFGIRFGIRL